MLILVLRIVIGLVVLAGLITVIMSVKNWHWAQMVLLLFIFFSAIGTLFLGLEVFRIHKTYRKGMPALEKQLAELREENAALKRGTYEQAVANRAFKDGQAPFDWEAEGRMPGMSVWTNRLQMLDRERGRTWSSAVPQSIDRNTGAVAVAITAPQPHGLEKDAIVFAFEQGPPNAATPEQGPQYLGEFRVLQSAAGGVQLALVNGLDPQTFPREVARLMRSVAAKHPWTLYETMPTDNHSMFARLTEEELKQLLPALSVEEYLRHGKGVTADDDQYHRAAFDEKGNRVALDSSAKTEERYDRPLRNYASLLAKELRDRIVALARRAELAEDLNRLKATLANAKTVADHRTQEKNSLSQDGQRMKRDRQVIERLLATVRAQLDNAKQQTTNLLAENVELAKRLTADQLRQLGQADLLTPAPVEPLAGGGP